MIVYHGSYVEVENPNISYSRDNLDFGKGFYVTPIIEQAKKWAERFKIRKKNSVILYYEIDEKALNDNYIIKNFESYSEEWLEYIISCRKGINPYNYDIVIGGVANDKVFNTVELYFDGLIDKNEAIKRLKFEKPNLQMCFLNQEAIDKCIKYIKCEVL